MSRYSLDRIKRRPIGMNDVPLGFVVTYENCPVVSTYAEEADRLYALFYSNTITGVSERLVGIAKSKEEAESRLYNYARNWIINRIGKGQRFKDLTGLAAKVTKAVSA